MKFATKTDHIHIPEGYLNSMTIQQSNLMSRTILFALFCASTSILLAQDQSTLTSQLFSRFKGTWELQPSTLTVDPLPPSLDREKFRLRMRCDIGKDSLSLHCEYEGQKALLDQLVHSHGQELWVFDPGQNLIYKLGGIRNQSEIPILNSTHVTIGKGVLLDSSKVKVTEYLTGQESTIGTHLFEFLDHQTLLESSTYTNETGDTIRSSAWKMKKVEE